jgi:ankyrin repeat protein
MRQKVFAISLTFLDSSLWIFNYLWLIPVRSLLETTTPKLVPDLIRDPKMRTPLLVACAAGRTDVVKVLIEFGADPNCPTGDIVGNKPLDLAVISNNVETVIALLDAGNAFNCKLSVQWAVG